MGLKPANKNQSRLRLAIAGPAGSGKTYSSLLIASGLADWDKICVIDTERGSANCYADLGAYFVLELEPPYKAERYIAAIKEAEAAGMKVIIVDSLSHAWAGEGGLLDQHSAITDKTKNSFSAWREVTPMHNRLVDTMLQSQAHVIATLRTKTEYVVEDGGKRVRKVGLAPIQRDGLEYEFTIFGDLSPTHLLTVSKDRTGLFQDQAFLPDAEMGRKIKTWLVSSPILTKKTESSIEEIIKEPAENKTEQTETHTVIIVSEPQDGFAPAVNIDDETEMVLVVPDSIQVGMVYRVEGKTNPDGTFQVTSMAIYEENNDSETVEIEVASTPKEAAAELIDGETVSGFACKAKVGNETVTVIGNLETAQKGQKIPVTVTQKTLAKGKAGETPIWIVSLVS